MGRILATSIVVAGILGIGGAHALFLGWWTLVPWGIAGIVLGYRFRDRFVITGLVYGFVLVYVFMIGQYTGDRPLVGRLPAFGLLAIFGAVCGLVLTAIGSFVRNYRSARSTGG